MPFTQIFEAPSQAPLSGGPPWAVEEVGSSGQKLPLPHGMTLARASRMQLHGSTRKRSVSVPQFKTARLLLMYEPFFGNINEYKNTQ